MRRNLHEAERSIRMVAGFIIFAVGLMNLHWSVFIGPVLMGSALFGVCPLYSLLHIHTDRRDKAPALDGRASAAH